MYRRCLAVAAAVETPAVQFNVLDAAMRGAAVCARGTISGFTLFLRNWRSGIYNLNTK
jgi:hypothetical protein